MTEIISINKKRTNPVYIQAEIIKDAEDSLLNEIFNLDSLDHLDLLLCKRNGGNHFYRTITKSQPGIKITIEIYSES